ncbi:MAG: nucleotide pyrophosphohydrolase [Methylococcaceae bacterium]|nr:nucleotide pyrophosphohydrolase [Methylococcaceae bacterium]
MPLTIKELLNRQQTFDEMHSGEMPFFTKINENNLEELEHLIVCLLGELGEFANILKKVRRGDFSLATVKDDLDEELVDVFIYLLKIAGQFNVDLEDGYEKKILKNTSKFQHYKK